MLLAFYQRSLTLFKMQEPPLHGLFIVVNGGCLRSGVTKGNLYLFSVRYYYCALKRFTCALFPVEFAGKRKHLIHN